MKILKFSAIVAGIHLMALILIFANPGCSSSSKPAPSPGDTVAVSDTPTISIPGSTSPITVAPQTTLDPIAINGPVRYSPTRPNTAAANSLQTEPVANVTPATTYTVVQNDNLTVIARRNHLTIAELAAANNLSTSARLHLGQKLIIPNKVPPAAKLEAAVPPPAGTNGSAAARDGMAVRTKSADSVVHVVQSGEYLSVIARKYGVKQSDIAVANNITDPQKIRAGMELIIPGWQAPASKAAKSGATANPPPVLTPAETDPLPRPAPVTEVPVIRVEDAPTAP